MPDNPNYRETKEGWWKKDKSITKGFSPDWARAERIKNWTQEIRKDRAERNKKKKP